MHSSLFQQVKKVACQLPFYFKSLLIDGSTEPQTRQQS